MDLKIASLNVNSIANCGRRNALHKFLIDSKIDICLVQETKVDADIKFNFLNYNILRNDLHRGKCGTAIFIKNHIPIRNHTKYSDCFHANSVDALLNGKWTNFTACYFPPGLNVNEECFKKFFLAHINSFLGGDFNGRHEKFGDVSSNIYGQHIFNIIHQMNGSILNPPSPTCFRGIHGSFIDKFINFTNNIPNNNISLLPSFSDHFAILTRIPLTVPYTETARKIKNYNLADIQKINTYIELNTKRMVIPLHENLKKSQIEDIVAEYDTIVKNAINKFTPTANFNAKSRVILSTSTRRLQAECKALQRKLVRNHPMQHYTKTIIINKIRHLRIMIKNASSHDTASYFTNVYNNVANTQDAFKTIKNFTGHKRREQISGVIYTDDSKINSICGGQNITDALGQHFAKNHNLTSNLTSSMDNIVGRDCHLLECTETNIVFDDRIGPFINDATVVNLIELMTLYPPICKIYLLLLRR